MRNFSLSLLLYFVLVPVGHADEVMDTEIDYILNAVAASDCVFIRNGKEHGPESAKDHLNMKRRRGKKYYSNADEFIENLASSSSWSGKPYHIRCGDEEAQLAKDWFDTVLSQYRAYGGTPTAPLESK
jgi:hypothetical protein